MGHENILSISFTFDNVSSLILIKKESNCLNMEYRSWGRSFETQGWKPSETQEAPGFENAASWIFMASPRKPPPGRHLNSVFCSILEINPALNSLQQTLKTVSVQKDLLDANVTAVRNDLRGIQRGNRHPGHGFLGRPSQLLTSSYLRVHQVILTVWSAERRAWSGKPMG